MKKKVVVGSVAALLVGLSVCSYQLSLYQSQEEQKNRVSYIEDTGSAKKTNKETNGVIESLSPEEVSAKENISAEQIVVKITDEGYVTSHGDHFHYYNGKVPYDAIFSEELLMTDPQYVLQDSHIINEVKNGYIIKVDGRYYLYLSDKQKRDNIRNKEEIARQQQLTPEDSTEKPSNDGKKVRDGRYSTDDGYVFNPSDVIGDTGDGFIVPHGGHFHFIPKKDLSPSELKAAQDYWNHQNKNKKQEEAPTPPSTNTIDASQPRPRTGNGQPQPQPQPKTDRNQPQPQPQPKTDKDQPQTEPVGDDLPSLLAQLDATPLSQRHVEADGLVFDPRKIVKKTDSGVVIPHGNHYHFIPYHQLSPLERKIVDLIKVGGGPYSASPGQPAPKQPNKPIQPSTPPSVSPIQPTPPSTQTPAPKPIAPELPSKPTPPSSSEQEAPSKPAPTPDVHEAPFDVNQIISSDEEGYVVAHGDHTHYFYKKNLTPEQIQEAEAALAKKKHVDAASDAANLQSLPLEEFSRDASEQEKMDYIAKTYGIPLEAIRSSNDYFVFNNPDHAYDPTHIHPYAVLKKNVRIPLVTGQAELDLLNELYTTALRSGISPYRLKIENGTFVIPHDGHNHYIRVQTENIQKALEHRLPTIHSAYVAGNYDGKVVREKIQELIAESKRINADNPSYHRQVIFALESFWETVSRLASNSTEGYLAALDTFSQQYIKKDAQFVPSEESVTDKQYRALVAKVEGVSFDGLEMTKEQFLASIQEASLKKDTEALEKATILLDILEKLDKQPGIAGADLLRQFYENYRDPRLSTATRERVEEATLLLYRSQVEKWNLPEIRKNFLAHLRLRDEMLKELATSNLDNPVALSRLDKEKANDISYTERVGRFLDEVYGVEGVKQDEASKEVKLFLKNLSQDLRRIRNRQLRNRLNEQLEVYVARAYDSQTDKNLLLLEVKELPHYIQLIEADPERLGKKNTEIAYTAEELARAKEAGKYTTSDGYIFDPRDIEADEGDAYVVPHLGHSHWIPKADLSENERKLAAYYAKIKGLVPATKEADAASETTPPTTDSGAASETEAPKESTEAMFDRVVAEKRIPLDKLPYNTAYVVDYKNGRLIIPHYDHYHNIALSWFDNGHYKAPEGYTLEDFLATVKYYIEHPEERPSSDQGWGSKASDASDTNTAEEEKEDSEEVEEDDEYTAALKERAAAFGMTSKEFESTLITLTLRYGVSLEHLTYDASNKTVTFTDKEGQTRTVSIPQLTEVTD